MNNLPAQLYLLALDSLDKETFPEALEAFLAGVKKLVHGSSVRLRFEWSGLETAGGPSSLERETSPQKLTCRNGKGTCWIRCPEHGGEIEDAIKVAIERLVNVLVHQEKRVGTDWLTNLPNRFALEHFTQGNKPGNWHWVALVDIDDLKQINEERGYAEGDAAIRKVAKSLDSGLCDQGLLFRIGGDEFLAILSSPSQDEATQVMKDLSRAASGVGLPVSIGAAQITKGIPAALDQADRVLRDAKAQGPGSFRISDP